MRSDALRLDWEIARRGYARYAAYPAATLAGAFTNTVFGFMRAFVLLAMFEQRERIGGYDASAAATYVWVGQALIMTIFIYGWQDLGLRIRTGDIAADLVRPVDPLRAGLAFDLGRALYHGLYRGIPPLLIGALVFRLVLPAGALEWLAFAASLVLAVVVSYAFRVIYNTAAFWTTDLRGAMMLGGIAVNIFSGFIIPVGFFPDWLAAIAHATPFPSMIQLPIDIFVGRATGVDVLRVLAIQVAWAIVLLLVARQLFSLGVRRLVVQGG
jgi:ABC-2 type transport system permease protein